MTKLRSLLAAGLGAAWLGLVAPAASAACHAFEVTAAPATVAEGAAVEVTVSRDGAVGASQIDVETIDGSARGGADYAAVARRTISFTNETSQTFPVQTGDDADPEGAEDFRLHLSNPGGCTVNPNFSVGPDATVTIAASDESGSTATTGAAPTTAPRTGTSRPAASGTPPSSADFGSTTAPPTLPPIPGPVTETTAGSSTTREAEFALAEEDEDDGLGAAAVIAVLGLVAVLGATGWWTWRRRSMTPV